MDYDRKSPRSVIDVGWHRFSSESETLKQQAANNTKEQFANSPDLKTELMNAIIGALEAHTAMSTQALGSETVRNGLKDVLLGPARLYEILRQDATGV